MKEKLFKLANNLKNVPAYPFKSLFRKKSLQKYKNKSKTNKAYPEI